MRLAEAGIAVVVDFADTKSWECWWEQLQQQ